MARPDGYPDRYAQVVRRGDRIGLYVSAVALAVAVPVTMLAVLGPGSQWRRLDLLAAALDAVALLIVLGNIMSSIDVRTVRVFPYFESEVGEIHTFLHGKALARHVKELDELAQSRGVRPLSEFGFHDDLDGEALVWHDPADGLATFDTLLDALRDGAEIDERPAVIADIEHIVHALNRALRRASASACCSGTATARPATSGRSAGGRRSERFPRDRRAFLVNFG